MQVKYIRKHLQIQLVLVLKQPATRTSELPPNSKVNNWQPILFAYQMIMKGHIPSIYSLISSTFTHDYCLQVEVAPNHSYTMEQPFLRIQVIITTSECTLQMVFPKFDQTATKKCATKGLNENFGR